MRPTASTIVYTLLEDVDNLSVDQITRMARSGECSELCSCGAYCTLIHYRLPDGTLMPRYHVCQTCDNSTAAVEEAKRKPTVPDPDDPMSNVERFVTAKTPYFPDYAKLARLMQDGNVYASGHVERRDHSYAHEYTTEFELEVEAPTAEDQDEIGTLADKVQTEIQAECVNINKKIYRALNREWDWLNSDEAVDDNITANEYLFDEEGEHDAGDLTFEQLNDEAKEQAREWYREGGLDYDWWEHIYEEWTAALKEMGFDGIDIAFSGFSSQGDGASFTAKRFDFLMWANWFMSAKTTERGHPYTDDLFLEEADDPEMARIRKRVNKAKAQRLAATPEIQQADDPTDFIQREVARRSEPIKSLEIRGRRWWRRGPGGTYCKAYIYINDKLVHVTPELYGSGDHYLTLAQDWLTRNGYLAGLLDDRDPLWHLRDKHGIELHYGVTDVRRERDL
jgi:hypothetical protein